MVGVAEVAVELTLVVVHVGWDQLLRALAALHALQNHQSSTDAVVEAALPQEGVKFD